MKIIYNRLLPFPGYSAMMFFGVILARKKYKPLTAGTVRHEEIHRSQAVECGGYILYYLRYLWYCLWYGYRKNPFEIEAYTHAGDEGYTIRQTFRAWEKYR